MLIDAESAWGGEVDTGGCWPIPLQKIPLASGISEDFPVPLEQPAFVNLSNSHCNNTLSYQTRHIVIPVAVRKVTD